MKPPSLNLIGPGRVGRTLARLWQDAGLVRLGAVVGRDAGRSREACAFIGGGTPCAIDAPLPAAELTLIATPDDALAPAAAALAASAPIRPGDVVFHCSGALPAAVLAPLRARGALVASLHPLKSFAAPAAAIADFAGTFVAAEGDAGALALVGPLFDAIGARRFALQAEHKILYHSAAVLACNHLVALMEAALRCMEGAGVARDTGWAALQPLVAGTLANLGRIGTAGALTGPVARGDRATVTAEIAATSALDADVGEAYRVLSLIALQLAPPSPGLQRKDIEAAG
jgi:predicted short-subunit dehydrogenase-like oxidoreductase (DUF2520 family)